jgi:DNA invertase Pin-like site-specific DNA recombinase
MAVKIYFTDEQEQEIIKLFNNKINLRRIGKQYGVTDPVIKRILAKYNIKPKQRRHDVNEECFVLESNDENAL